MFMENKLLLFCFFIFVSSSIYSQILSGKITYSIDVNKTENNLSNQFKKFEKESSDIIQSFKFTLVFNRNESIFFMKSKMNVDLNNFTARMSVLATRGDSKFYVNTVENQIIEQKEFLGQLLLIKSSTLDLEWTFTKKTKVIGDYLCYQAIAKRENSGPLKEEDKFSNYIAWYCPELSFKFGPYEVTGLPGLVLEFSNERTTYYASKIEFNDSDIEIEKPSKGKVVTKYEYLNIGQKAFEDRGFSKKE